jgi:hypothetical protein
MWPMDRFHVSELRGLASGIVDGDSGAYTAEMFIEDYPPFKNKTTGKCFVPTGMLNNILAMCNDIVSPDRWGSSWRLAAGLFVAHYATLYLRIIQTSPDGATSIANAAASGQMFGIVTSASLGDASVSYDTSAATNLTTNWGQWNLTAYGQQYASLAKMMCMGGCYVQ